ncbi:MAG: alpha/beta fold hydrolase [Geodermatophilaceae bacterium]|nr:alpha/beta fold hydrolase [Geodermatophilaceae bacterium]MDQ3456421.1 alpha/beta fold hydrolase [Actinomycetota bacterium]
MSERARSIRLTALRRRPRRTGIVLVVVGLIVAALVAWSVLSTGDGATGFRAEDLTVAAGGEVLDATILVPDGVDADHPAPAIVVAHGFGGSKQSVRSDAEALAGQRYVVLTYSARGFGDSTGEIGLNSPDFEVADAQAMLDLLAQRPEVEQDGPGDPRVGITGPSYGGALALLTAGYDDRVDAVVPQITWNSLVTAFFPNYAGASAAGTPAAAPQAVDGVFKKLWAGLFFASGAAPILDQLVAGDGDAPPLLDGDPLCGRFRPEICAAYVEAATTGRLSPESAALLERSSPASILDRITAPTLLIQGEADSLFPLSEADANARGIAASGTEVALAWYTGGHDGAGSDADTERLRELTSDWFDHHLRAGPEPTGAFEYAQVTGLSTTNGRPTSERTVSETYPGLVEGSTPRRSVELTGPAQPAAYPPGGSPAAISLIPGLSQLTGLLDGVGVDVPGQAAAFETGVLDEPLQVVGSPTVSLRVASPTGQAVLFAKLYDVDPDGQASLPQGLVAPIRLTGLPTSVEDAAPVEITLPALAYRFEAQHTVRLVLATTDQGYLTPVEPVLYQVAVAAELSVPSVEGEPVDAASTPWIPFLLVLAGSALAAGVVAWLLSRRRRRTEVADVDPAGVGVPLVVTGLTKAYADGFVAVRDLSFRVEAGQVVGLLGPNGAGKTTTLRMLMGLITPTAGELRVFGHRVHAGAPVLSRLGAFVEGTGFLPHLSGRDNLALYWRATGRPAADARFDEALEISGLGAAVDKKVRTYSQGMRQRLAIAQAMLGLPDLLVLDEPTNGLDPPQIREMRAVLRRYVDGTSTADGTGRTVLVSSHLLAEVEQTCTHVVVMHRGALVAQGTVVDVVGESSSVLVGVDDRPRAVEVLRSLSGVLEVADTPDGVVVELNGLERSGLVRSLVGAGVGVQQLTPRRRLEDVFIALVGEGHDVD